jgi:hypothetical protein
MNGFREVVGLHLGNITDRFRAKKLSCMDGWALATKASGHKTSLALFEQQGRSWLRSAAGSPAVILSRVEYNFPVTPWVLRTMAAHIGVRLKGPPPIPIRLVVMMPLHPDNRPYYRGSDPDWLRTLLLKRLLPTGSA